MDFASLTSQEQYNTLTAMKRYGGGFAAALANAWSMADRGNSNKLATAFPDLVERYGPGSAAYEDCSGD